MANRKRNSFYIQGSILAAASVISRLIGIAFKLPIQRMLGEVGYGIYSEANEIYSMALLLSTFSIPMALSKLVSARETKKEYINSYKILKIGFVFSSLLGLATALLFWFFAGEISAFMLHDEKATLLLKALAPTIFVFSIMGVLRGFFQGKNTALPTSISQIIEQIVHVGSGIALTALFLKIFSDKSDRIVYGAVGATLGTLAGAVTALVFLTFIYVIYRPLLMKRLTRDYTGHEESNGFLFKMLLVTMFPIMINQILYSVTGTIDTAMSSHILALKGFDDDTRHTLNGIYLGQFRLLTNVPIAVASAIGISIIPNMVMASTEGRLKDVQLKIHQAVKLNMMIAIPSAFGLMALAEPIINTLFDNETGVGPILMLMGGMSVVFYAYSTTTNSILQGMGRLRYPVMHAIVGIIVYCIFDFWVMYYTDLGIYTLALGYMVFPFTVGLLNWFRVGFEAAYRQELLKTFVLPTLFSVIMGVVAYLLYRFLLPVLRWPIVVLVISIGIAGLIYAFLMIFTRTLTKEEMLELPMGARLVRLVEKTGFKL